MIRQFLKEENRISLWIELKKEELKKEDYDIAKRKSVLQKTGAKRDITLKW